MMNKSQAFLLLVVLGIIGIGGTVVLMILAPDSAEKFMGYLINLLVILGGFAGFTYAQAKQTETIETIKHNTNGTLSARDNEIAALRAALAESSPDALAALDTGAVTVTRVPPAE